MAREPPNRGLGLCGGAGNRRPNSACSKDCCSSCSCGCRNYQTPNRRPFTPVPACRPADSSDSSTDSSYPSRQVMSEYYPATPVSADHPRLRPFLQSLGSRDLSTAHYQRLDFRPETQSQSRPAPCDYDTQQPAVQSRPAPCDYDTQQPAVQSRPAPCDYDTQQPAVQGRPAPSSYPTQQTTVESRTMEYQCGEYNPPPIYSKRTGSLLDNYESSGYHTAGAGRVLFPQYSEWSGFSEDSILELPDDFPLTSTRLDMSSRPCDMPSRIYGGPVGGIDPSVSERTLWQQPTVVQSYSTISDASMPPQPQQQPQPHPQPQLLQPPPHTPAANTWWAAVPSPRRPEMTPLLQAPSCATDSTQQTGIPGSGRLLAAVGGPGMDLSQPFLDLVRALPWDTVTGVRRIEEVFVTDSTGARDAGCAGAATPSAGAYSTHLTAMCPSATSAAPGDAPAPPCAASHGVAASGTAAVPYPAPSAQAAATPATRPAAPPPPPPPAATPAATPTPAGKKYCPCTKQQDKSAPPSNATKGSDKATEAASAGGTAPGPDAPVLRKTLEDLPEEKEAADTQEEVLSVVAPVPSDAIDAAERMSQPQVSRVSGDVYECEDLKYCKSCCMYHIEGMHIPTPAEPERLLATVTPDPSAAVVAEAPAPASAPPERRGQSIHFDVTIRPASCGV